VEVGVKPHCTTLQQQCSVFRRNCQSFATAGSLTQGSRELAEAAAADELGRQQNEIGKTIKSLFDHDQMQEVGKWNALEQTLKGIDSLLDITQRSAAADLSWVKDTALFALEHKVVSRLHRPRKFPHTDEVLDKYLDFHRQATDCTGQPISLYTFTELDGKRTEDIDGEKVITFLAQSQNTLFEKLKELEADRHYQAELRQICDDIQKVSNIAVNATKAQYAQSETGGSCNTRPRTVVFADCASRLDHRRYQKRVPDDH